MKQPKIEIAVYLPDEDAKKWMLFQEHYDLFTLLLDKDVFNQKNASISLHFDSVGTLQTIQRADFLYSRKHDLSTTL